MTTMAQPEPGGLVQLYRPATGATEWVPVPEAARAMITWAAQEYGQGTPGFAVMVERAVQLLAEHGLTPAGAVGR
jgi:hypothetical protein